MNILNEKGTVDIFN